METCYETSTFTPTPYLINQLNKLKVDLLNIFKILDLYSIKKSSNIKSNSSKCNNNSNSNCSSNDISVLNIVELVLVYLSNFSQVNNGIFNNVISLKSEISEQEEYYSIVENYKNNNNNTDDEENLLNQVNLKALLSNITSMKEKYNSGIKELIDMTNKYLILLKSPYLIPLNQDNHNTDNKSNDNKSNDNSNDEIEYNNLEFLYQYDLIYFSYFFIIEFNFIEDYSNRINELFKHKVKYRLENLINKYFEYTRNKANKLLSDLNNKNNKDKYNSKDKNTLLNQSFNELINKLDLNNSNLEINNISYYSFNQLMLFKQFEINLQSLKNNIDAFIKLIVELHEHKHSYSKNNDDDIILSLQLHEIIIFSLNTEESKDLEIKEIVDSMREDSIINQKEVMILNNRLNAILDIINNSHQLQEEVFYKIPCNLPLNTVTPEINDTNSTTKSYNSTIITDNSKNKKKDFDLNFTSIETNTDKIIKLLSSDITNTKNIRKLYYYESNNSIIINFTKIIEKLNKSCAEIVKINDSNEKLLDITNNKDKFKLIASSINNLMGKILNKSKYSEIIGSSLNSNTESSMLTSVIDKINKFVLLDKHICDDSSNDTSSESNSEDNINDNWRRFFNNISILDLMQCDSKDINNKGNSDNRDIKDNKENNNEVIDEYSVFHSKLLQESEVKFKELFQLLKECNVNIYNNILDKSVNK